MSAKVRQPGGEDEELRPTVGELARSLERVAVIVERLEERQRNLEEENRALRLAIDGNESQDGLRCSIEKLSTLIQDPKTGLLMQFGLLQALVEAKLKFVTWFFCGGAAQFVLTLVLLYCAARGLFNQGIHP